MKTRKIKAFALVYISSDFEIENYSIILDVDKDRKTDES